MEGLHEILAKGFKIAKDKIDEKDRSFVRVEKSLNAYLTRARETLQKKHQINPKVKRLLRVTEDNSEDEEEQVPTRADSAESRENQTFKESRPCRTAKSKAAENLKEVPLNVKMRNDTNVTIKKERPSIMSSTLSRESIKENEIPEKEATQKRKSPDEGIQSASESDTASKKNSKRSTSVELINDKLVSIDISSDVQSSEMPPPALLKKTAKNARTKPKAKQQVEEPEQILRITRSKIKQEKLSIVPQSLPESEVDHAVVVLRNDETTKTKKPKKKYPLPLLIKIEPNDEKSSKKISVDLSANSNEANVAASVPQNPDETYRIEPTVNETVVISSAVNETVTISSNAQPNGDTTVTLSKNNQDSIMTSDNDDLDEDSMEAIPPPLPAVPKKKNELFNPYMASPVKQKVQAFEKHATRGAITENYNTLPSKLNHFKIGTPSKIGVYSKVTTPLSLGKLPKVVSSSTGTFLTSYTPGHGSNPKKPTKMHSLSQESLDDTRKNHANLLSQQLEDKRKQREEKMRQAQQQREAKEKEKRDQVLKLQQERDEKYRKIMREKEEKIRTEALKKKILKEKQAKKYAEEKAKKDEFAFPKPVEPQAACNKNDSLHKKLQKSILSTKKKAEKENVYSFDMLNTDDETDDESRPSAKRPPIPEWSLKKNRKAPLQAQSFIPPEILDSFFGTAPINVDLKEIFPSIEAKKLLRNSSAIWRTPPKNY